MEKKYIPPLTLLLISVIVTASVAVTLMELFTQTFPPVAAFGAIVPNCGTPEVPPPTLFNFPRTVAAGSSGFLVFRCGDETTFKSAFNQTSTASLSFTPLFVLPSPYTQLGVFAGIFSPTTVCTGIGFPITNGTAIALAGGAKYSYCARYANAPAPPATLPSFNINWTIASA